MKLVCKRGLSFFTQSLFFYPKGFFKFSDTLFRRYLMKKVVFSLFFMWPIYSYSGTCDYPDQLDSAGRRCGKRAASVRSGGHLDGDGSTNVGPDDVFSGDEDVIIEFKPPLAGSNSKKVFFWY